MTSTVVPVDPTNATQSQAWNGAEGDYWAVNAARFEQSMAGYDAALFAAAAIGPGDNVLDVGCGTGSTTREAARRADRGSATGIDLSGAMIAVARDGARGSNAGFLHGDAQVYPFPTGAFDVVLSRTGAMFFGDPAAAFANLARATRPGGRAVLLVWQGFERNPWMVAITTALAAGRDMPAPPEGVPGPFALADPGRIRNLLAGAGYTGIEVTDVREPLKPRPRHRPHAGRRAPALDGRRPRPAHPRQCPRCPAHDAVRPPHVPRCGAGLRSLARHRDPE